MIVISVLLWLLKTVLFLLLTALMLLVLSVVLVLFVPIRYSCDVAGQKEKQDVWLQANWLFVGFTFDLHESEKTGLKVLGFRLWKKKAGADGTGNEVEEDDSDEVDSEEEFEADEEFFTGESGGKDSIINRVKDIVDKVKYVLHYPDRDLIVRYTVELMKKLIRAIVPKTFQIGGVIGTGDACQTGQLLGGIYAVLGFAGVNAKFAGDFETKHLWIECKIAGKIALWDLLFPLVIYIIKKPIWKIVRKQLFRRGVKE